MKLSGGFREAFLRFFCVAVWAETLPVLQCYQFYRKNYYTF